MSQIHIIDHPLIQHKISLLRDRNTGTKEFRELVAEIANLICYEATRDLPLKEIEMETPLAVAKTKVISGRKLAFIPILRAGLGMLDGNLCQLLAPSVLRCPEKQFQVDHIVHDGVVPAVVFHVARPTEDGAHRRVEECCQRVGTSEGYLLVTLILRLLVTFQEGVDHQES